VLFENKESEMRKFLKWLRDFINKIRDRKEEPVPDLPEPIPEPKEPDVEEAPVENAKPGTGSQFFLWKPISESTRTCVVLLPSRLRPSKLTLVTVNGSKNAIHSKTLAGWPPADDFIWANGDRIHLYLNSPGVVYGRDIKLAITYNGNTHTIHIPDGDKRVEFPVGD